MFCLFVFSCSEKQDISCNDLVISGQTTQKKFESKSFDGECVKYDEVGKLTERKSYKNGVLKQKITYNQPHLFPYKDGLEGSENIFFDIETSAKGLIVNIKGDFAFPSGKADMKPELEKLLDTEIIPRIQASPFQVEVAGHSDSDPMPKKWQKFYKSNWELSAARGATVVRYMIEKSVPAPRLLAAGYGDWYPRGIDSVKKANPMYNPLTLTWEEPVIRKDRDGNEKIMPTVLSLNATKKQKAANRRIQITFINPPHHGKGRSATSYEDD